MAAKKTPRKRSAPRAAAKRKAIGAQRRVTGRVPVAKTYKLYIGGKFPRSESGRYFPFAGADRSVSNVCRGSRKDFRDAVVAARGAFAAWQQTSAYLRGQIVYRIAEMLEGRSEQFAAELERQGVPGRQAAAEVAAAIDRLVYYAGWADKYQQIFSSVNPVSTSHFNFSLLEPMGVVAVIAPQDSGLLGLVSNVAPAIVGGNTCIVLASQSRPLSAISFGEVLHASDVPGGVVNLLTGLTEELSEPFASHMDVNALVYCDANDARRRQLEHDAANNIKRVLARTDVDWRDESAQGPYFIVDTQEVKTTWHPVGG